MGGDKLGTYLAQTIAMELPLVMRSPSPRPTEADAHRSQNTKPQPKPSQDNVEEESRRNNQAKQGPTAALQG